LLKLMAPHSNWSSTGKLDKSSSAATADDEDEDAEEGSNTIVAERVRPGWPAEAEEGDEAGEECPPALNGDNWLGKFGVPLALRVATGGGGVSFLSASFNCLTARRNGLSPLWYTSNSSIMMARSMIGWLGGMVNKYLTAQSGARSNEESLEVIFLKKPRPPPLLLPPLPLLPPVPFDGDPAEEPPFIVEEEEEACARWKTVVA